MIELFPCENSCKGSVQITPPGTAFDLSPPGTAFDLSPSEHVYDGGVQPATGPHNSFSYGTFPWTCGHSNIGNVMFCPEEETYSQCAGKRDALLETLARELGHNSPSENPDFEKEYSRLWSISGTRGLEQFYIVLARYNTRKTGTYPTAVPNFAELHDHIQRATMTELEPFEWLLYYLVEAVIMDLSVSADGNVPPPGPPCWTYLPGQRIDAGIRSTQLTKVLTFADSFELGREARGMLPKLKQLESRQGQDEDTTQKWRTLWLRYKAEPERGRSTDLGCLSS